MISDAVPRLLAGLVVVASCHSSQGEATSPSTPVPAPSFVETRPAGFASLAVLHEWVERVDEFGGEPVQGSAHGQGSVHRLSLGEREVATIEGEGEACPDELGVALVEFVGIESFALVIDASAGMRIAALLEGVPRCWSLLDTAPFEADARALVRLPTPEVSANLELRGDHEGIEQIDSIRGGVQVTSASGRVLLAWQPSGCFGHGPRDLLPNSSGPPTPLEACADDAPALAVHAAEHGLLFVLRFACADGRSEEYGYWWPWTGPAFDSYCMVASEIQADIGDDPSAHETMRKALTALREAWPLGPLMLVRESVQLEIEREFTEIDDEGEASSSSEYWGESIELWTVPVGNDTITRIVAHESSE